MLLAIDPGVHRFGVALFEGLRLVRACWVGHEMLPPVFGIHDVVIEMPRIYPGSGQRKGDLNDLLDLAASVGYVEGLYREARQSRIFPAQWKGQVPKKIMNARVLARLDAAERRCIESVGAKDHNTIDAIGIGLHHLGRL
jgi:hypothetical protein